MSDVIGNCSKHPGFNMVNCPLCEIDRMENMKDSILGGISEALKGCDPVKVDKSIMIKLTPEEIKNVMKEAAHRYYVAMHGNTKYSIDELIDFHYDISFGILKQTDPDRFIYSTKE